LKRSVYEIVKYNDNFYSQKKTSLIKAYLIHRSLKA